MFLRLTLSAVNRDTGATCARAHAACIEDARNRRHTPCYAVTSAASRPPQWSAGPGIEFQRSITNDRLSAHHEMPDPRRRLRRHLVGRLVAKCIRLKDDDVGVRSHGELWPVAGLEAFKAWGRYTSLGLPYPTAATPDGPATSRTHEEH
jgi:hypothetical protein